MNLEIDYMPTQTKSQCFAVVAVAYARLPLVEVDPCYGISFRD